MYSYNNTSEWLDEKLPVGCKFPSEGGSEGTGVREGDPARCTQIIAEGESKISGHLALLENEGKVDDRILATDPGVKAIEDWCEESKLLIKWYDTTAKDGERKSVQIFPVASLILSCSSWCCSPDPCDFAFIPCILHRRAV